MPRAAAPPSASASPSRASSASTWSSRAVTATPHGSPCSTTNGPPENRPSKPGSTHPTSTATAGRSSRSIQCHPVKKRIRFHSFHSVKSERRLFPGGVGSITTPALVAGLALNSHAVERLVHKEHRDQEEDHCQDLGEHEVRSPEGHGELDRQQSEQCRELDHRVQCHR